jgi:pimeloyl-ACP methyl ester carboxylesterase
MARKSIRRLDKVYVEESGTPRAPAVVFIHGGGPSGAMWRDHLEQLATEFDCHAPDFPRFGRSDRLSPISLSRTADLVAELIEARVPSSRAHVVGLSSGGSVVFALLDRHPEVLDRVVVDGACVLPQLTPEPPSPSAVDRVNRLLERKERDAHARPGWQAP